MSAKRPGPGRFAANRIVIEITCSDQHTFSQFVADSGSKPDLMVTAIMYETGTSDLEVFLQTYHNLPPDPYTDMQLAGGPPSATYFRVEVPKNEAGEVASKRVRETTFK